MDQNKSGSLSDEYPASKREENDSDWFESVDASSVSRSRLRSRSSDGNSRARKRPQKVKSLPRSWRMISDLEKEREIGLFCIFKGFKKKIDLPQNSKIFKILWVGLGNLILSLSTK